LQNPCPAPRQRCGDTAIFSDLKLIGKLYAPTIGCVGITNPQEIQHRVPGPGRLVSGEMNACEGALAAQGLGLHTVLPCHSITTDHPLVAHDLADFQQHLDTAAAEHRHAAGRCTDAG